MNSARISRQSRAGRDVAEYGRPQWRLAGLTERALRSLAFSLWMLFKIVLATTAFSAGVCDKKDD